MPECDHDEFVLGLDLGTNSLGWSIIGLVDGEPARLVREGVRVIDEEMEGGPVRAAQRESAVGLITAHGA